MPAVISDYINQYTNFYKNKRAEAIAANNKIYDEQEKAVNDVYNQQISDAKIAYDEAQRDNAIQKLINENEIAENMANMGLEDSGLNRTQMTANQLSYANNRSAINRQKNADLRTIAQTLASEISAIKQNRIASESAINEKFDNAIVSDAQTAYKAKLDADVENNKNYYSYLEKQAENKPFILDFKGVTREDDSDNEIRIYTDSSGKKYEAKVGHNPYTGADNASSKRAGTYGFFKNGYQPKGIVDKDGTDYGKLESTGVPSYLTGKKQDIWSSTDKNGTEHFWLWSGIENAYVEMVYDSKKDEYITTAHKVYF